MIYNPDPKIEKGIPMPERNYAAGGIYVSAFEKMAVGDSFTVNKIRMPAVYAAAKKRGCKAASRAIEGTELMRVWCIEKNLKSRKP